MSGNGKRMSREELERRAAKIRAMYIPGLAGTVMEAEVTACPECGAVKSVKLDSGEGIDNTEFHAEWHRRLEERLSAVELAAWRASPDD